MTRTTQLRAIALVFGTLLFFGSCTKNLTLEDNIQAVESEIDAILNEKSPIRIALTDSLFGLYDSFVKVNELHEKSPGYLYQIAEYWNAKFRAEREQLRLEPRDHRQLIGRCIDIDCNQ